MRLIGASLLGAGVFSILMFCGGNAGMAAALAACGGTYFGAAIASLTSGWPIRC